MSSATQHLRELRKEVMSLPQSTRALLAQELLESLDTDTNEIEREWGEEAERRLEEIKSGKVKTIPADEVFRRARIASDDQC